jgi:hypothetical protein
MIWSSLTARFFLAVIFLILTIALSGCGPTVKEPKTVYDFVPPEDEFGRACVLECAKERNDCIGEAADANYEAELDYRQCRENRELMRNRYNACLNANEKDCVRPPPGTCWRQKTGRTTAQCQTFHRMCYQDCGGTVTGRIVQPEAQTTE